MYCFQCHSNVHYAKVISMEFNVYSFKKSICNKKSAYNINAYFHDFCMLINKRKTKKSSYLFQPLHLLRNKFMYYRENENTSSVYRVQQMTFNCTVSTSYVQIV